MAGGLCRAGGINDNNRKVELLPSLSHQTCLTSGEIVIQIRLVCVSVVHCGVRGGPGWLEL